MTFGGGGQNLNVVMTLLFPQGLDLDKPPKSLPKNIDEGLSHAVFVTIPLLVSLDQEAPPKLNKHARAVYRGYMCVHSNVFGP